MMSFNRYIENLILIPDRQEFYEMLGGGLENKYWK